MRALEFLGSDGSWYALVHVAEEARAIEAGWTRLSANEAEAVLDRAAESDAATRTLTDLWMQVNGIDEPFAPVTADALASRWAGEEMARTTTHYTLWRVRAPLRATGAAEGGIAPLLSDLGGEQAEERTWVAFRLLDLAGDPLPDVPYEIELSDGSTLSGTTDGDGNARHEGIVRGGCTVTFSDLPDRYWQHEHNA